MDVIADFFSLMKVYFLVKVLSVIGFFVCFFLVLTDLKRSIVPEGKF